MKPAPFDYVAPSSLEEALAILVERGDEAKVLAGGQSLVSLLKLRLANPKYVVDLGGIGNLSYIREEKAGKIVIGAMPTYADVDELLDDGLVGEQPVLGGVGLHQPGAHGFQNAATTPQPRHTRPLHLRPAR